MRLVEMLKDMKAILLDKELVIVYQMGKVGSKTVVATIEQLELNCRIIHAHNFYIQTKKDRKNSRFDYKVYSYEVILNLRKFMAKRLKLARNIKVISGMRNPIDRNMSSFYHNIDTYKKDGNQLVNVQDQCNYFFEEYYDGIPLNWFRDELIRFSGINIFDKEFDKEKGYMMYQNEIFEILILTAEKMNESLNDALKNFMNIEEDIKRVNANVAQDKAYFKDYTEFKNAISYDKKYLDKFYKHPVIKYFYDAEQIIRFREKY